MAAPPAAPPVRPPRRRLSPQQVLLGLGALLLVAGAIAFVALAWTRLGLAFQAAVMLVVTAAACGVSAWSARRGLRATEEALAAAGAALLAVDLGGAYAKGLLGVDALPERRWAAIGCAVLVLAGAGLGRLTRTTATWPLVALLAAQPVPFLLMSPGVLEGPAGGAAAFAVAAVDVAVALRLRRALAPVAAVLAGAGVLGGAALSLSVAASADAPSSWTATGVLAAGGAGVLLLLGVPPAAALLPRPAFLGAGVGAGTGLAVAGSLHATGRPGAVVAAALAVALLTAAVLLAGSTLAAGTLTGASATLGAAGALVLVDEERLGALAAVLLAATVPAVLAALRLPRLRAAAAGAAVLAPVAAVLTAAAGGRLDPAPAGLLLALLAAAAFAVAALRAGEPEEWVLVAGGGVAALAAAATSGSVGAWGQVGLQLAVAGAAAGCYALVARRPWVAVAAVADLVVACWIAVGGAGVQAPEAYTLPAAAGLLVVALPRLRAGAPSWAAEGAAVAVAVAPSAFVAVTDPSTLRLVLVVLGAAGLTVAGTLTHRQAPFVVGSAALAFVVLGRLGPYAPLLPRWLLLTAVGLVLLVLGATYERRRQQAREAVAWVGQMH
jgi:hypothetical protein